MSYTVIHVEGVSKRYRIGEYQQYQALRDVLTDSLYAPFRRLSSLVRQPLSVRAEQRDTGEAIWALRDVSFDVKDGEVIGIIGRNGVGKSTLLKILSRITGPTEGYARIHGRMSALLEVGCGFHPELTGRENIYLNGAILGMRKAEINRKFEEIVAFAEVERFIDTPVKRYSSGMKMRLAFAVAAHLEPEILVVDEVLAVGDAAFQRKCLGKMDDVAKEGRTVLFVSHNLLAVQSLCGRVIWLKEGRIAKEGCPDEIISEYLQDSLSTFTERVWPESETAAKAEWVRLHRVCVRPSDAVASESITVHTPFLIEFEYWNLDPKSHLSVSFCLYNEHDILLFDICPPFEPDWRWRSSPAGLLRSVCHIPGDLLNNGVHRVALLVSRNQVPVIKVPDALIFNIQDSVSTINERDGWYGKWQGAIRPMLKWETNLSVPENSILPGAEALE
jgi:lipopolysaccharide transport system ATP-binding protein